ncbi:MAG: homoserine dehydrogenase [Alphaproteobacteria bacterium]|nr:homoserine dehydrogenase [Alphaproteobacteria bacterium]
MRPPLRVGLAGLGTVGIGTLRLLTHNGALLAERAGRPIIVTALSSRTRAKAGAEEEGRVWYDDPAQMAKASDLDVIIEVIGGTDTARSVIETAIASGKHVVTANKSLLAEHGLHLARQAEAKGVALAFEAAVAGGIPIIKAIREGLVANRLSSVIGILNGTCNYILTQMETSGRAFEAVLAEAQALGYAEADPTLDVGGTDTAHKLALLTSLAFGAEVDLDGVSVEGITKITPVDIAFAGELGYRIKLLGIAALTEDGVLQRVHPAMVPRDTPLGDVGGVFNAVVTEADAAGRSVFEGRGAGPGPTASAVVSDLVDIARGRVMPPFVTPVEKLVKRPRAALDDHVGPAYLRISVLDKPGVLAMVASRLAAQNVSIESMIQRGRAPGGAVSIVMLTHDAREGDLRRALEAIAAEEAVVEKPCMIRIERPDETPVP